MTIVCAGTKVRRQDFEMGGGQPWISKNVGIGLKRTKLRATKSIYIIKTIAANRPKVLRLVKNCANLERFESQMGGGL